jgi:glutamate synthase (NADPH/NADH) small chain
VALPGRELDGIHSAMSYLVQRNRAVAGVASPELTAAGKHVVVIGGGDTAADCVASAHREHAASVTQLDIYPQPAGRKYRELVTWPDFPKRLWSTYALDEGGERRSSFNATAFTGDGHVEALVGDNVGDPPDFEPTGEAHELPADLVLIAIGFTGVERGLVDQLDVAVDERGAIMATRFATSADGVFACGDARRGQSLIVTAIAEGRQCAEAVERYLTAA